MATRGTRLAARLAELAGRAHPQAAAVRSEDGRGPLFWAKEFHFRGIASQLAKAGAWPTAMDAKCVTVAGMEQGAAAASIHVESSAMYDAPQRLSVVLEQHEDGDEWAVVAVLIDERGGRRRSTLGRFARRADAARHMGEVFDGLPKTRKAKS